MEKLYSATLFAKSKGVLTNWSKKSRFGGYEFLGKIIETRKNHTGEGSHRTWHTTFICQIVDANFSERSYYGMGRTKEEALEMMCVHYYKMSGNCELENHEQ